MSDPLRGTARYTADVTPKGPLHVAFLRADRAHGVLLGLDIAGAQDVAGVVDVLVAGDLGRLGNFPAFLRQPTIDGRPLIVPHRPVMATDRVRYVGELVAMVLAQTAAAAQDGVEALAPEYDDLPAIVGLDSARTGPDIHPEAPGNRAARVDLGDAGAVADAMNNAARVVETTIALPRVAPHPMEPMAAIAAFDPDRDLFDLWVPHQGIAEQRRDICAVLGVAPGAVRIHAERVGGAFGVRGAAYPETIALLAAARRTGRVLRWQASRSDGFATDYHGRGTRLTGRLALDSAHRFTAISVQINADLGAYVHPVGAHISVNNPLMTITGCYRIPAARAQFDLMFTNAVPMGPYRGAGRPDIALLVERLVDMAAIETGQDPLDLRRINAVGAADFPWRTPLGAEYDSGDYPALIDTARRAADWDGFAARANTDRAAGLLRGIGAALFVEVAGGGATPRDEVQLHIDSHNGTAHITLITASQSTGQDHAGLFCDMITARLGLPPTAVTLEQSAPDAMLEAAGSYASRSTTQIGSALYHACDALIARLIDDTAAAQGVPPDTLTGDVQAIRDNSGNIICTLAAALDRAASQGAFSISGKAPVRQTYPSGCHIAEVAIDPATGLCHVLRYLAVDDAGRVLSHHGVDGQLRGGIAQGIANALFEGHVFDASGQILSGSLMDYTLPRAQDMPPVHIITQDSPSPTNPLGAKGVGEAGTTGALAATTNAVADALRQAGATLPELPLTPARIWEAVNATEPKKPDE
ncbi:xanthine dehydrogenase family protein molybdopterin-binding subunit [Oceaniglobus ichthyenteri]|uniref:xanthine dehydrogenase family protein molybdopterin-binding subunit n=1 Tax=Oceaniglobus ichthyenteri TaxID=2136177 RepID=UPI000D333D54|nr:xanthine dehydrogenase family protein molybdopterin-binding subunit [Oceaniglobus ichthyenteri]